jgi:UDP-GlcNAc:undecaprenyl-phosphate GlcNAc-1-phosphate transferase
MNPILVLVVSIAISMLVIPVMWRLAPVVGLIDRPDPRKVHRAPVPRVGGWGIVAGALLPTALLLGLSPLLASFIAGGLVLFAFGVYDDCREAGHWQKFLGQAIAAGLVVYWGGLYVTDLPLLGREVMPVWLGQVFTLVALVGVMNATNHADGLDGLAGGETLLSLIVIGLLLHQAGHAPGVVIACALAGGILGFLRYNSHPAQVFMGDSGSQFLGFTVGVLVVLLTQQVNTAISPAAPLFLIGLPVVDILAVLYLRARSGQSWFRATRNHIHHRLMDLGFVHAEVVVAIYGLQALLVTAGFLLRYESDLLLLGLYLALWVLLFGGLTWAERTGWRAHRREGESSLEDAMQGLVHHPLTRHGPRWLVALMVPVFLVLGAGSVQGVPGDFGAVSALLAVLLAAELLVGRQVNTIIVRAAVYASSVFVVYLTEHSPAPWWADWRWLENTLIALLALAIWSTVRYGRQARFQTNPTDYLVVFGVVGLVLFGRQTLEDPLMAMVVVKAIVLLYASELQLTRDPPRFNALSLAALAALTILGYRGLADRGALAIG